MSLARRVVQQTVRKLSTRPELSDHAKTFRKKACNISVFTLSTAYIVDHDWLELTWRDRMKCTLSAAIVSSAYMCFHGCFPNLWIPSTVMLLLASTHAKNSVQATLFSTAA